MSETKDDQELRAIQQVIAALSDLDSEARARVINYVFQRLGISSAAALVAERVNENETVGFGVHCSRDSIIAGPSGCFGRVTWKCGIEMC
jgi:hypothetical protein